MSNASVCSLAPRRANSLEMVFIKFAYISANSMEIIICMGDAAHLFSFVNVCALRMRCTLCLDTQKQFDCVCVLCESAVHANWDKN